MFNIMKKKILKVFLSLLTIVSVSLPFAICAKADDGPGTGLGDKTPMFHSKVVGCGSYNMHDWKAGCCEGYGGCVNECFKSLQFCD